MPSFDIVSEVDSHELSNAVDQANREVENRFDFKGVDAKFTLENSAKEVHLTAPSDFQVKQMGQILDGKMTKREIDIKSLSYGEIESNLHQAKQKVTIQQGITKEQAKKMIKLIKDSKLKVQASIQGEQVRVTGKSRDDLQEVMALVRGAELDHAVQFNNFRD
jgi:cyclic-di-GMP-binding protein